MQSPSLEILKTRLNKYLSEMTQLWIILLWLRGRTALHVEVLSSPIFQWLYEVFEHYPREIVDCLQSHPFSVKVDGTLEWEGLTKINELIIIFVCEISKRKTCASNQRYTFLVMLHHKVFWKNTSCPGKTLCKIYSHESKFVFIACTNPHISYYMPQT